MSDKARIANDCSRKKVGYKESADGLDACKSEDSGFVD